MNTKRLLLTSALCACASLALAAPMTVPMHLIDANGIGKSVGTMSVEDSKDGLVLMPKLEGLPPGVHGFHVHENPSCAPMDKDGKNVAGLAAGGHFDPDKSGKHAGPTGKGHIGDLPAMIVNDKGVASKRLVAPQLKMADIEGRALMIHEGGDNYADEPKLLGGGGARIACGVVQ